MGLDWFLPPRRGEEDESLASFVERRLGREALERMAQPMIASIYGADPRTLSLSATMPRFLEMERSHGSVIRAMVSRRKGGRIQHGAGEERSDGGRAPGETRRGENGGVSGGGVADDKR